MSEEATAFLTADGASLSGCSQGDAAASTMPALPAYYHKRTPVRHHQTGPRAADVHWQENPSEAAKLHPYVGFLHQAEWYRQHPHPPMAGSHRWPDGGFMAGGPPHRLDTRKHSIWFGYQSRRTKGNWIPEKGPPEEPLSLTMDSLKVALTRHFGSLQVAWRTLDFFKDGQLSTVEWTEGVRALAYDFKGKEGVDFRNLCTDPKVFSRRMTILFKSIDIDGDGLISFDEFSRPVIQPVECSRDFTLRRSLEHQAAADLDSAAVPGVTLSSTSTAQSQEDEVVEAAAMAEAVAPAKEAGRDLKGVSPDLAKQMRSFAALLLKKYSSVDEAFKAIDINHSGQLSMAEFSEGCTHRVRFGGDARSIFKALDKDDTGTISVKEFFRLRMLPSAQENEAEEFRIKTKREIICGRRERSPIKQPPAMKRGMTLASMGHQPLGETVSNCKGYHTFGREATGRMDPLLHIDELPGYDPQCFNKDRGPGCHALGPGHFAEVADRTHPQRGTSWIQGATQSRTERFAHHMPSHTGKKDRELSAIGYASYEGQQPNDTWRISETGAHSMKLHGNRIGPTMGNASDMGLLAPTAVGRWGHSRVTLACKSRSEPSLLKRPAS